MTTSKKKTSSTAKKPRNQSVHPPPNTTGNRFDSLTLTLEETKPLYSEIASSNRVSEIPTSSTTPSDTQTKEPSLSALMGAIQNVMFRFDDREEELNEKFKSIDERFENLPSSAPSQPQQQLRSGNCESTQPVEDHIDNHSEKNNCLQDTNDDLCHSVSNMNLEDSSPPNHHPTNQGRNHPNSRRGNYNRYNPPSSADSNYLNQNQFSVAITNSNIKYDKMESYLSSKVLANDSAEAFKTVYSSIVRAIAYGFACQLDIMPSFQDLARDTHFEQLFLCGLFSDNLHKAKSVFDQIGEIILDFLKNESTISETKAPEAYTIVKANVFVTGWVLLETILQQRLTMCGADLDDDLDAKRINLAFEDNESYREFYVRTQQLHNEYRYHATDPTFIPVAKLMRRFLDHL